MNAPVAVDGGDGFDTLVLIGTEADDIFVISRDGIWGAGRFISFVGIEKVDVDGAEGDDLFYVVSTSPTVQTRIFGGLGSDTILVGAAAPSRSPTTSRATAGSSSTAWRAPSRCGPAAGRRRRRRDRRQRRARGRDDPRAPAAGRRGRRDRLLHAAADQDAVQRRTHHRLRAARLARRRGRPAAARSWCPSRADGTWPPSPRWSALSTGQRIYVKAVDDPALESDRYVVLQHLVVQSGGNHEYDALVIANAVVRLVDNDKPAVTVVAAAPVRVAEGGATGSYQLSLTKAPRRLGHGPGHGRPETRVSLDGTTWSHPRRVHHGQQPRQGQRPGLR